MNTREIKNNTELTNEVNTGKNEKKETTNYTIFSPLNEDIRKTILEQKKNYVATRSSKLQPGVAEKIVKDLTEKFNLTHPQHAIAILTMLFQQGGTARSCDGNMSVTFVGKTVKLAEVRKILKENSCNKSERKLARTLANEIREIANLLEIPGNLHQKIQKQNLDSTFTMEQKVWLSDFQSDNENCPIELRKLILETFKKTPENKPKKK